MRIQNTGKIQKVTRKSQNGRNQGFSYYFCLMMDGSGTGSGSVLVTNGSRCGSGRPKNIRIHNTVKRDLNFCIRYIKMYESLTITTNTFFITYVWRALMLTEDIFRILTKNKWKYGRRKGEEGERTADTCSCRGCFSPEPRSDPAFPPLSPTHIPTVKS